MHDLLRRLADRYLYAPLWSADIHAEWMRPVSESESPTSEVPVKPAAEHRNPVAELRLQAPPAQIVAIAAAGHVVYTRALEKQDCCSATTKPSVQSRANL